MIFCLHQIGTYYCLNTCTPCLRKRLQLPSKSKSANLSRPCRCFCQFLFFKKRWILDTRAVPSERNSRIYLDILFVQYVWLSITNNINRLSPMYMQFGALSNLKNYLCRHYDMTILKDILMVMQTIYMISWLTSKIYISVHIF